MQDNTQSSIVTQLPPTIAYEGFMDAQAAAQRLLTIYRRNTQFIQENFMHCMQNGFPEGVRFRACYPSIRIRVDTYQEVDSRLSYGHVVEPGFYASTITQPDLFFDYLVHIVFKVLEAVIPNSFNSLSDLWMISDKLPFVNLYLLSNFHKC